MSSGLLFTLQVWNGLNQGIRFDFDHESRLNCAENSILKNRVLCSMQSANWCKCWIGLDLIYSRVKTSNEWPGRIFIFPLSHSLNHVKCVLSLVPIPKPMHTKKTNKRKNKNNKSNCVRCEPQSHGANATQRRTRSERMRSAYGYDRRIRHTIIVRVRLYDTYENEIAYDTTYDCTKKWKWIRTIGAEIKVRTKIFILARSKMKQKH